jgi:hypothetical protein
VVLPIVIALASAAIASYRAHPRLFQRIAPAFVRIVLACTALKIAVEWALVVIGRDVDFDVMFWYRAHATVLAPVLSAAVVALLAAAFAARPLAVRVAATTARRSSAAFVLAAAVWVWTDAQPVARWSAWNAPEADYDAAMARAGLMIDASTAPDAVIAAARVGAISYFSDRRSIDLLGKSDPQIARMKPVAVFKPGHDRWDYPQTFARTHPDVIGVLWLPSDADRDYLARHGYVHLDNGLYVARDSARVDVARLDRDLERP